MLAVRAMRYNHHDSDPLDAALRPPADETEDERTLRLVRERQARAVSEEIDAAIKAEQGKKKKRVVRLLLLGQSESGKSTTLRQFQRLYTPTAFREERILWRAVIQLNIVRSIRMILDALAHVIHSYSPPPPQILAKSIAQAQAQIHGAANQHPQQQQQQHGAYHPPPHHQQQQDEDAQNQDQDHDQDYAASYPTPTSPEFHHHRHHRSLSLPMTEMLHGQNQGHAYSNSNPISMPTSNVITNAGHEGFTYPGAVSPTASGSAFAGADGAYGSYGGYGGYGGYDSPPSPGSPSPPSPGYYIDPPSPGAGHQLTNAHLNAHTQTTNPNVNLFTQAYPYLEPLIARLAPIRELETFLISRLVPLNEEEPASLGGITGVGVVPHANGNGNGHAHTHSDTQNDIASLSSLRTSGGGNWRNQEVFVRSVTGWKAALAKARMHTHSSMRGLRGNRSIAARSRASLGSFTEGEDGGGGVSPGGHGHVIGNGHGNGHEHGHSHSYSHSLSKALRRLSSDSSTKETSDPLSPHSNSDSDSDPDPCQAVLYECQRDMQVLWADPKVRDVLRRKKVRLEEGPGFFLNDLKRVTSLRFMPTDDDVLKARLKTVGVSEYKFEMEVAAGRDSGTEWRIVDVGGSRSLRHAWVPFFEDVDAIIFLAPISAFDQVLMEDRTVNRLEDSVLLWKSVCQNKLLANVELVLFLNKCDILEAKLNSGIRLAKYIKSYGDRENDSETVTKYLKGKFSAIHREYSPQPRKFYSFATSVTDTTTTAGIIASVRDMIVRRHLLQSKLL